MTTSKKGENRQSNLVDKLF